MALNRFPLLLAGLTTLVAVALAPSASATCVTVAGTGACVTLGGSGTGPGVVGSGGLVCVDTYCPTVGKVPYNCVAQVDGVGALSLHACVGYPVLPPL
jgi:hypothetical protein